MLTNDFVDKVIRGMKPGKAAALDGIMAEHLQFSDPIICVLLSLLFKCMLSILYCSRCIWTWHDYSTFEVY